MHYFSEELVLGSTGFVEEACELRREWFEAEIGSAGAATGGCLWSLLDLKKGEEALN